MTKDDIANALMDEISGLPKKEAVEFVDLIFRTIKETLAAGEGRQALGFANFTTKSKRARSGRNPKTGEPLVISARTVVKFKPSEVLRKKLNKNNA